MLARILRHEREYVADLTAPPSTSTTRTRSPSRTRTARPAPAGTTMRDIMFVDSMTHIEVPGVTFADGDQSTDIANRWTFLHPQVGRPTSAGHRVGEMP